MEYADSSELPPEQMKRSNYLGKNNNTSTFNENIVNGKESNKQKFGQKCSKLPSSTWRRKRFVKQNVEAFCS